MSDVQKQRATGRIDVTNFEAQPCDDAGASPTLDVNVTEEFAGDLVGVGSVQFLMVNEPDGAVNFTGMERYEGRLGERSGSFIFQNSGTLKAGVLESVWQVIPGSGTRELAGLRGHGGCTPQGYTLDYWFE